MYLVMHRRVEQKNQTQSNHWEKKRFFIREREQRENREVDLHMARKRSSAMNTVT